MRLCGKIPVISICVVALAGCARTETDNAKPAPTGATHSSIAKYQSGSGYKQDEDGNWLPNSDKRSLFDSQRESAYFKGKMDKKDYKTGDYAKKSWWGSDKDFGRKIYEGNTDGSRFQTTARQEGQMSRAHGQQAKVAGPFETNTLDRKSARESGSAEISRPRDAATQSQRKKFTAPSVIDWQEQRQMSVDQSRGILGR